MQSEFSLDPQNNCPLPKRFLRAPDGYTRYRKDPLPTIIYSRDVGVTTAKIKDNAPNVVVIDHEELMRLASSSMSSLKNGKCIFIINCTGNHQPIFDLACKTFERKFIIVSSEKESLSLNLLQTFNISEDRTVWEDLSPCHQDEIKKAINRIFGNTGGKIILNLLQKDANTSEERDENEQVLLDLINERMPRLFNDTLPSKNFFYIPRKIISRTKISVEVFRKNKTDVFLFYGIQRHQLSAMVTGLTDISDKQILKAKLTSRFIILVQPGHFDKICQLTRNPVHLLNFNEDRTVTWLKSKGDISSLQGSNETCQVALIDEIFLTSLENLTHLRNSHESICISDKAGMGKSELLAELGRKLRDKYPSKLVIFTEVRQLIEDLRRICPDQKTISTEIITDYLETLVCVNKFARTLFRSVEAPSELEVLLDGFDEINAKQVEFAYNVLSTISSMKRVRMWVTTRPHYLPILEKRLQVLGHNIEPFGRLDQLKFLKTYWNKTLNLDDSKLEQFARSCLNALETRMHSEVFNIAGIPLQCRLIGEVYENDAVEYATACGVNLESFSHHPSISSLFEKFIERRFDIYSGRYATNNISADKLMQAHQELSLTLLFPGHAETLIGEQNSIYHDELLKIGLLVDLDRSHVPKFIHRTFAEYFVAKYVFERVTNSDERVEISKLFSDFLECINIKADIYHLIETGSYLESDATLFQIKTKQFVNSAMCYFLDGNLKDVTNCPLSPILCQFFKDRPKDGINFASACVHDGLEHILKFLDTNGLLVKPTKIYHRDAVFLGTKRGNLELVKFLCQRFKEFNITTRITSLKVTTANLDTEIAFLLQVAVARGDYDIVEYLLQCEGYEEILRNGKLALNRLLQCCARNSINDTPNRIQDRNEIIRRLVDIGKSKQETRFLRYLFTTDRLFVRNCWKIHPSIAVTMQQLDVIRFG